MDGYRADPPVTRLGQLSAWTLGVKRVSAALTSTGAWIRGVSAVAAVRSARRVSPRIRAVRTGVSMPSILAIATFFTPAAQAFCGTYVGGAGAELYNNVAQVAVVRQDGRTTLSMANDVEGDTSDFALVVPVPEVLPEDAIHTLDKGLFARLDAYSAPRLVEYECRDFRRQDTGWLASDGGGDGGGGADTGGVDVEAEYVVGEYRIVILSAQQSTGLFTWLNDNGYAVPANSQALLQQYIDAGSYFFAAKVDADAGVGSGDTLSPLQFTYEAEAFGLPIRLGTLNAREVQDLIIYGVNEYARGRVGISNYTEVEIDDECMWDSQGESFEQYYADRFTQAYEDSPGAVWVTEYAWGGSGCDPCTGDPPDDQDLVTLGYDDSLDTGRRRTIYDVFFTRLHRRYTPYEAGEDLVLYHSNMSDQIQQRYIRYQPFLEDRFPVCDEGMRDDPGSCDGGDEDDDESGEIRAGCGRTAKASGAGFGLLALLGVAGLRRRRGTR